MREKYMVLCNGEIRMVGNNKACMDFINRKLRIFPTHMPLTLVKFIEEYHNPL